MLAVRLSYFKSTGVCWRLFYNHAWNRDNSGHITHKFGQFVFFCRRFNSYALESSQFLYVKVTEITYSDKQQLTKLLFYCCTGPHDQMFTSYTCEVRLVGKLKVRNTTWWAYAILERHRERGADASNWREAVTYACAVELSIWCIF
jgi:hypothetical protein